MKDIDLFPRYLTEYVENAQFDYNSQNIRFMPKEIYLKYLEKDKSEIQNKKDKSVSRIRNNSKNTLA